MTGLLQRLGARATGTAWAVRSDARLPFGAERTARLSEAAARGTAPAAPPPGTPQQAGAAAGPMAAPPPLAAAVPARPAPATHAQASGRLAMDRPQDIAAAVRTPAAPPQLPVAAPSDADAPPPARPQAHGAPAPQHAQPASTGTAAPRARAVGTAPPELPAPLLPAMAGSPAPPPNAMRAALAAAIGQQRSPAAAQQETEVHIHIGRIDVTALHEAPRPKARPPERAQPMSLDAYLAKRGSAP